MKSVVRIISSLIVFSLIVLGITGCTAAYTPTGFATPSGGLIYTGVTYPADIDNGPGTQIPHRVLKKVHGVSEQTCILGLVSFGDGSVFKASRNAIFEVNGADDIIIRQVDTEVKSILMLFTEVTTHVRGDAIQYIRTQQ